MTTTENYFKAFGWEKQPIVIQPFTGRIRVSSDPSDTDKPHQRESMGWVKGSHVFEDLPHITQSFPDFKKWVLEKMEGEGYALTNSGRFVNWCSTKSQIKTDLYQEIKNNEILEAAVISATRYLEPEK